MVELADCRVDLATGTVHGGRGVALTERERRLFAYLVERPSVVVPRDELLREVWGWSARAITRAVDSTVFRLREKVEVDPASPRHLLTAHGVGYRFEPLRTERPAELPRAAPRRTLQLGDRRVDLDLCEIDGPDGVVRLTAADASVLTCLADRAGGPVEARELARRVGASVGRGLVNRIHRLRTLLEPEPDRPRHLLTVRGRGYRLVTTPAPGSRGPVTLVQVRPTPAGAGSAVDAYGQAVDGLDRRAAGEGGVRLADGWRYAFDDAARALAFATGVAASTPLPVGVAVVRGRPLLWVDPVSGRAACVGAEVHRAEDLAGRAAGGVVVDAELWADPAVRADRVGTAVGGGAVRLGEAGPDAVVRGTLPWVGDRFVGREELLARVVAAVARPGLVTLEGPAGVGKSRLALEALARPGEAQVFHVAVGDVTRAEDLVARVAAALGVISDARGAADQLGRVLGGLGRAVLWLDDADRVGAPAGSLLVEWLASARALTVLATVRRALGVAGEQVVGVEPLADAEAAALFVERASGVAADDPELAAVVGALDGLPLAIELAAARTRTLSPADLRRRLPDRLRLLAGPAGASRHRSLRAAIDLSWELLDEHERKALARASVFRAAFPLDAAEAVLDPGDPGAPWVLDVLDGLVRHHLVRAEGDAFALLESVRDYAAERLAADPDGERRARAAHCAYHASFGSRTALAAFGRPGGPERLAWLARALPDLEQAARDAAELGLVDAAEAATLAIGEVRARKGPFAAALPFLDAALALDGRRLPELLATRGFFRGLTGDPAGAGADLEAASARAEAVGDRVTLGLAETWRGTMLGNRLSPDAIRTHHQRALDAVRPVLDRPGAERVECLALLGLGELEEPPLAVERLEAALRRTREVGDRELEGRATGMMAIAERLRGRTARARELALEALRLHRETGDRRAEAIDLGNVANTLRYEDPEAARAYNRASMELHRRNGSRRGEALARGNLGAACFDDGDLEGALEAFTVSVELLAAVGATANESNFRANLGAVLCRLGRADEGEEQLLRALALAREVGDASLVANPVLGLTSLPAYHADRGLALLDEAEARPLAEPDMRLHLAARRGRLLLLAGGVDGAREELARAEGLRAALPAGSQVSAAASHDLEKLRDGLAAHGVQDVASQLKSVDP